MKELDKVEADRARCVAIVNAKFNKEKVVEPPPEPKVWTKEKIDDSDIVVQKVIKEVKPTDKTQPSLF